MRHEHQETPAVPLAADHGAGSPDGKGWRVRVTEGPGWIEIRQPAASPLVRIVALVVALIAALVGPVALWSDELGARGFVLAAPVLAYLIYVLIVVAASRHCLRLTSGGVESSFEPAVGLAQQCIAWSQVHSVEQMRWLRWPNIHPGTSVGLRLHDGAFFPLLGRTRHEERDAQRALEWLRHQIDRVMKAGGPPIAPLDRAQRIRQQLRSPFIFATFGFFAYLILALLALAWMETTGRL
jgi:hypothetical protein